MEEMMKRMAVTALSILMLLTLTACGVIFREKRGEASGDTVEVVTPADDSAQAALPEAAEEPSEKAAEEPSAEEPSAESTEEPSAEEPSTESTEEPSAEAAEEPSAEAAESTAPVIIKAEDTRQVLRIIVPAYSDNSRAWWSSFEESFEEAHEELNLIITPVSADAIEEGLQKGLEGKLPPDIVAVHDFSELAAKKRLLEIERFDLAEMEVKFFEGLWEAGCLDGKSWGIPLVVSTRSFYYNRDIFEKAGIETPPATWDELREACRLIKAACGEEVRPLGLDWSDYEGIMTFAAFAGRTGGFVDAEGGLVPNTQANVETLNFLGELFRGGFTNEDPAGDGREALWDAFAEGSVAMLMAPPALSDYLSARDCGVRSAHGAVPVKTGDSSCAPALCDCLVVLKNKEADQEARNEAISLFFAALYDDETYADYVRTEGFLPVTYTAALAMAEKDFGMEGWMVSLSTARCLPDMMDGWDLAVSGVIEAGKKAMETGNAAGELLAAQAELNAYLAGQ